MELRDIRGELRITPKRILLKLIRPLSQITALAYTTILNSFSKKSIIDPRSGVVVSMTTHGARLDRVHHSIESISRGQVRPMEITLWLDKMPDEISPKLQRLMNRGLRLRESPGRFGPHTKYFPHCLEHDNPGNPLVTADDDILYPSWWLKSLLDSSKRGGLKEIVCHRAHRIALTSSGIEPYNSWQSVRSTEPSWLNFAAGVSGVLYPPKFQVLLAEAGDAFQSSCPRADDIWLHAIALRNNFRVRQISARARVFPVVLGTQVTSLQSSNVVEQANDAQILRTYTSEDIQKMFSTADELN